MTQLLYCSEGQTCETGLTGLKSGSSAVVEEAREQSPLSRLLWLLETTSYPHSQQERGERLSLHCDDVPCPASYRVLGLRSTPRWLRVSPIPRSLVSNIEPATARGPCRRVTRTQPRVPGSGTLPGSLSAQRVTPAPSPGQSPWRGLHICQGLCPVQATRAVTASLSETSAPAATRNPLTHHKLPALQLNPSAEVFLQKKQLVYEHF